MKIWLNSTGMDNTIANIARVDNFRIDDNKVDGSGVDNGERNGLE